ncbi:MAG: divergent polysaccharide deacetylase family protein [Deltaproteobacteria bacterium]|nr:divergent polysaccharide deacetylase family protein [Deltaproteobacteria bacterium]
MQKSKPSPRNRRKKDTSKRPFIYLLVTLILIVSVLSLLDYRQKKSPEKPPAKVPVTAPGKAPGKAVPLPEKPQLLPEKEKSASKELPVARKPEHKQETSPAIIPPAVQLPKITGTGVVAIIIDDMGSSVSEVRELMNIGVPLTFSIIPGLQQAREVANVAHGNGYEVMLHIPMEPQDYPQRRLERNGLLLSYGDKEIESRIRGFMNVIPHAVGANNHMGSRFTEDRGKMSIVLGVLKENGMFFIDSVTTPKSVGLGLSREMGVRASSRTAPFLDNSEDVSAIKGQLASLTKLAMKKGSAVGICHPHRGTIRALTEELPLMQKNGIRFVYASKLLK